MSEVRLPGGALRRTTLAALFLSAGASAAALPVAVSVPPQAYVVERVGGSRIEVEVIVPPGSAPESYEPSPRQVLALDRARLYVAIGHPAFTFEQARLRGRLAGRPGTAVIAMVDSADDAAAGEDPHVWLSPPVVERTAGRIAAALSTLDPDHRLDFEANLEAFRTEIAALEAEIRSLLEPCRGRRFLVFHPAWGHFAARYGLEQVAIEFDGKEPSPARLVELIAEAKRERFRVVFVQPLASDRSARILAREIGAEIVSLDPLAYDWPSSLRRAAAAFAEALCDG